MKPFKIQVCINRSAQVRRKMIAKLAVQQKIYATIGDALKMIRTDLIGDGIVDKYIIMAETHDLKNNDLQNERLFNAALHGIAVIIGSPSAAPAKYNFICKNIYPEDFNR